MKSIKDYVIVFLISLVTAMSVHQYMEVNEAYNVASTNVETRIKEANSDMDSLGVLISHPEELDINLVADPATCGKDTPIKAEITNESRRGLNLDRVEFIISTVRQDGIIPLRSVNQRYLAQSLDLAPDTTATQCFAAPYEVDKDIEYGNGDTTVFDYRFIALPKAVSYVLDKDVELR